MSRAKIDNPASRLASFARRRASLFKKAHELAVLCGAEVAIIIFSADGKLYEFASSSMQKILNTFKMCKELGIRRAMQSKPENPDEEVAKEAGVRKFLGKDLAEMSSQELYELDDKLIQGLLFIKDTKLQLLKDEVEKSRMQELQAVQKNQMLLRQVEELKGSVARSVYDPVPVSVRLPAMEVARSVYDPVPVSVCLLAMEGDREFLPSTSCAAITSDPETESNLQDAAALPLTICAAAAPVSIASGSSTPADPSTSFGAPLAILTTGFSSRAGCHTDHRVELV